MFDNRCPACNRPVVGDDEILPTIPDDVPTVCPHCVSNLQVVVADDSDIVTAYFDHDN